MCLTGCPWGSPRDHRLPSMQYPRRSSQRGRPSGKREHPARHCRPVVRWHWGRKCMSGEGGRGLRKDQQVPLFPCRTECRFCACVFRDSLRTLDREMSLTCSCQKLVSAQTERRAASLWVTICSRSWARLGQRPSVWRGNPGRFGMQGGDKAERTRPRPVQGMGQQGEVGMFLLEVRGDWWIVVGKGSWARVQQLGFGPVLCCSPFFFPSVTLLLRRVKSNLNV